MSGDLFIKEAIKGKSLIIDLMAMGKYLKEITFDLDHSTLDSPYFYE